MHSHYFEIGLPAAYLSNISKRGSLYRQLKTISSEAESCKYQFRNLHILFESSSSNLSQSYHLNIRSSNTQKLALNPYLLQDFVIGSIWYDCSQIIIVLPTGKTRDINIKDLDLGSYYTYPSSEATVVLNSARYKAYADCTPYSLDYQLYISLVKLNHNNVRVHFRVLPTFEASYYSLKLHLPFRSYSLARFSVHSLCKIEKIKYWIECASRFTELAEKPSLFKYLNFYKMFPLQGGSLDLRLNVSEE